MIVNRTVLITDHAWPGIRVEREVLIRVGAEIIEPSSKDEDELCELARGADAILTCFAPVRARVIEAGERLQVIGRFGIGVDNIDVEAATKRGIPVTNVPVYCLDEVAEHVLALTLTLRRRTLAFDRAVRAGEWSLQTGIPIQRLRGQTLGILGYGKIGAAVASRGRALGLRVIVHSLGLRPGEVADGIEAVDLDALAARSDILTLHAPLTEATRGIIDSAMLHRMKPQAVLINTSRGPLVDQEALAAALHAGVIAGAGLDVFDPERLPAEHPLLTAPNVAFTPHVAFYSEESIEELRRSAVEAVVAILQGQPAATVVNLEALSGGSGPELRQP